MAALCFRAQRPLWLASRSMGLQARVFSARPIARSFSAASPQQQASVPVFKNTTVAVHMPEEYYIGGDCLTQLRQFFALICILLGDSAWLCWVTGRTT